MLSRAPKFLALVLLFARLRLCARVGEAWHRPAEWSEGEIEQSVELNLQLDLKRMGAQLAPSGERLEQLRHMIRAEVEGEIKREREGPLRWVAGGLMLIVA